MFENMIVKYVITLIISMIPIIELRGAIPIAVFTLHLTYIEAFILGVIGNCIPIYFIVKFIRPLFVFFGRFKFFKIIIDWAINKANKKIKESKTLQTFTFLGLYLFVAIPLPVTGAWTGSLIANFLDLPPKKAFWPLSLGVFTAGVIILTLTAVANGGFSYLFQHM